MTGDPADMHAPGSVDSRNLRFASQSARHSQMVFRKRETSTSYASCPTAEVQAPVEVVWALLTDPAGWGGFFDVRIDRVDPPGPATVGQRIEGESGPRLLNLRLAFRFTGIDVEKHRLMLDVKLPFGITVREDLCCTPIDVDKCRVDYRCGFGFPGGWRGALARLLTHRERDAGPVDSLYRLKRAAEQRYADSRMNSGTRTP